MLHSPRIYKTLLSVALPLLVFVGVYIIYSQPNPAENFVEWDTPLKPAEIDDALAYADRLFGSQDILEECIQLQTRIEFSDHPLRLTRDSCSTYSSDKLGFFKASFLNPYGRIPFLQLQRKPLEQTNSIVVFLVGGPGTNLWGGYDDGMGSFFEGLIGFYDSLYIPAYYGTSYRSVPTGDILEFASKELDAMIEGLATAHPNASIDIISFSAGNLLSSRSTSGAVRNHIYVSPPLQPMSDVLRERGIFLNKRSRDPKRQTFTYLLGSNGEESGLDYLFGGAHRREPYNQYLKRFFGKFVDNAFYTVPNVLARKRECQMMIFGDTDRLIGTLDDPRLLGELQFTVLDGVDHNIFDTEYERELVLGSIGQFLSREQVCE